MPDTWCLLTQAACVQGFFGRPLSTHGVLWCQTLGSLQNRVDFAASVNWLAAAEYFRLEIGTYCGNSSIRIATASPNIRVVREAELLTPNILKSGQLWTWPPFWRTLEADPVHVLDLRHARPCDVPCGLALAWPWRGLGHAALPFRFEAVIARAVIAFAGLSSRVDAAAPRTWTLKHRVLQLARSGQGIAAKCFPTCKARPSAQHAV